LKPNKGIRVQISRLIKSSSKRDVASVAASQYISAGVGLATTMLVARILGPKAYGSAAVIMAFPALMGSIASVKSSSVTTRYITRFHQAGSSKELESVCGLGYRVDAIAAIAAFGLVAATAVWVSEHVIRNPQAFGLAQAYSASLIVQSAVGTSSAILASLRRFRLLGAMQITESVVSLVAIVTAATLGFGVPGMVLGAAAANVAGGAIFLAATLHVLRADAVHPFRLRRTPGLTIPRAEIASLFGWNYLSLTFAGILSQFPLLLLGRLRRPEQAGYFRLATSIVNVGTYFETALGRVAYPVLARRWASGEAEEARTTLRRWFRRGGLPAGALVLAGVVAVRFVVARLFGAGYRPMVGGLQIMLMGTAVSAAFFFNGPYYFATGRFAYWAKVFGTYAVLTISMEWLGALRFGFLGLAGAAALGMVAFNLGVGVPLLTHNLGPINPGAD